MAKGVRSIEAMGQGKEYARRLIETHLSTDDARCNYILARPHIIEENLQRAASYIRSFEKDKRYRATTEEWATALHGIFSQDVLPAQVLDLSKDEALRVLEQEPYLFLPGYYRRCPSYTQIFGEIANRGEEIKRIVVYAHHEMISDLIGRLNRKIYSLLHEVDFKIVTEVEGAISKGYKINEDRIKKFLDEKVAAIFWYQLVRLSIHPYFDYNGRVVRALTAIMLRIHGLMEAYERAVTRFEHAATGEKHHYKALDDHLNWTIERATRSLLGKHTYGGGEIGVKDLRELVDPKHFGRIYININHAITWEIANVSLEAIAKNKFFQEVMDNLKTEIIEDEDRIGGSDETMSIYGNALAQMQEE